MQTCADLEASAQVELPCSYFQGTHGVYCGCDNPIASAAACQICGDMHLPDPSKLTMFKGEGDQTQQIACGVVEFAFFLAEDNPPCERFQARYNETCCETAATAPTTAKPSNGPTEMPTVQAGNNTTSLASANFASLNAFIFINFVIVVLMYI